MILRSLLLLASLCSYVFADVKVVSPAAGASITGNTIDIEWEESGESPPITDFANYAIFLCAGGNDPSDFVPLATLIATGDYKKGNSISVTFETGLGADVENAYFLKFLSAATGGSIINFSDRFSLTSMDGVFPATVTAGLRTVSGTAGPPTENDIQTSENNPAASSTAVSVGGSASFALPYSLQTGPIRYAPMPKIGQTSITAKAASMQYPTSAYTVFRTLGGPADCISTVYAPITEYFSTIENTVSESCLIRI